MASTWPLDTSAGTAGGPKLHFAKAAPGAVIADNDGPRLGTTPPPMHKHGRGWNSSTAAV